MTPPGGYFGTIFGYIYNGPQWAKWILDIGLKKISAKFRWNWLKNKNFKPRVILHMKPMYNLC